MRLINDRRSIVASVLLVSFPFVVAVLVINEIGIIVNVKYKMGIIVDHSLRYIRLHILNVAVDREYSYNETDFDMPEDLEPNMKVLEDVKLDKFVITDIHLSLVIVVTIDDNNLVDVEYISFIINIIFVIVDSCFENIAFVNKNVHVACDYSNVDEHHLVTIININANVVANDDLVNIEVEVVAIDKLDVSRMIHIILAILAKIFVKYGVEGAVWQVFMRECLAETLTILVGASLEEFATPGIHTEESSGKVSKVAFLS